MRAPSSRLRVPGSVAIVLVLVGPTLRDDAAAGPTVRDAAASQVALSPCHNADNGYPDLVGVTVAPSRLDVRRRGGWLTVTARPVDSGGPGPATGVTEVAVDVGRLGSPQLAPQADGSWVARLRVPRGVRPGAYWVSSARLADGARRAFGHARSLYFDRSEAAQMGASVEVVARQDRRAPMLRWLRTSATSVDVTTSAAHVRVRARVTDATGVVHAWLQTDVGRPAQLRLRHGTRRDGIWAGTLAVPRGARDRSATYQLLFSAIDRPGTVRLVHSDELAARGLPAHLTVTTRRPDRDDPRIRKLTLAPAVVDLTGGDRTVTATVRATDRSGVADVSFDYRRMTRVAGDRRRGVWRRAITFDHCEQHTRDLRLDVILFDRAGNRVAVKQPISIVNRKDIRAPYPILASPVESGPMDPVTYRFAEDVVGISGTSAPVRPTGFGSGFGHGDPPPAVPGGWSCQSAAGSPADCVAGPVRTATWTPHTALTSGQSYGVDFNPEHVLDVLDLAGNPIDFGLRLEDDFAPTWRVR